MIACPFEMDEYSAHSFDKAAYEIRDLLSRMTMLGLKIENLQDTMQEIYRRACNEHEFDVQSLRESMEMLLSHTPSTLDSVESTKDLVRKLADFASAFSDDRTRLYNDYNTNYSTYSALEELRDNIRENATELADDLCKKIEAGNTVNAEEALRDSLEMLTSIFHKLADIGDTEKEEIECPSRIYESAKRLIRALELWKEKLENTEEE